MAAVTNPTYLLSPNWNFPADGPIAIGNVIADPFRPHRALWRPPTNSTSRPDVVHTTDKDWRLQLCHIHNVNLTLWTKILEVATLDLGAHRAKSTSITFEMGELETAYLREDPSAEDLAALVTREPRVANILNSRKWGRRCAVYIVSGLKIAKGFKLDRSASVGKGVNVGGEIGEVIPGVLGVGAGVEVGKETGRSDGFEAGGDIVFAYQLLRVRMKRIDGGEELDFVVDEFKHKKAFLAPDGDEDEEEDGLLGMETVTDIPSLEEYADTQKGLTVSMDVNQYDWIFTGCEPE